VIVIDCLGLAAPVAIGVTLGKEVKASDVVQAARQMLDPPERADEDLVLCQDYGSVYSHDTIFEGKEDLKEYAFSTGNIVLYRLVLTLEMCPDLSEQPLFIIIRPFIYP